VGDCLGLDIDEERRNAIQLKEQLELGVNEKTDKKKKMMSFKKCKIPISE
jgi:hypothetical protein